MNRACEVVGAHGRRGRVEFDVVCLYTSRAIYCLNGSDQSFFLKKRLSLGHGPWGYNVNNLTPKYVSWLFAEENDDNINNIIIFYKNAYWN